jgi:hypothetical protein
MVRIENIKITSKKVLLFVKKPLFCIMCLAIMTIIAIYGQMVTARRTIVFYTQDSNKPNVEERFIARAYNLEKDVRLYVQEIALGPEYLNTFPLLGKGTDVETVFVRKGEVFVSFSKEAAFPPAPVNTAAGDVFKNLRGIESDIRRNFPSIRKVRFFIAGKEVGEAL